MMFDIFNPLITQLFEISRDKWKDSETFQNLRMAVRDRLRRETKLNAELLKKFCKKKRDRCSSKKSVH